MNLLLLGAGFSRNWGGWLASEVFEWLLGHPAIASDNQARALLWRAQKSGGGFEEALSEIQQAHARDTSTHQSTLDAMQRAIADMFDEMNRTMHARAFEFTRERELQVATFLGQFDAIFTLNQDTLLEHFYCNDNVQLNNPQRWNGVSLPGLERATVSDTGFRDSWAYGTWTPARDGKFELAEKIQAIYKLHGSANWRAADGGALLIMGGGKTKAIADSPLLQAYMDTFRRMLMVKGTRLMTIGYGYRDDHINDAIVAGAREGLRLFNISPSGSDAAKASNPGRGGAIQPANNPIEDAFESNLFGASRRPLAAIFGDDIVEHRKVLRFFD